MKKTQNILLQHKCTFSSVQSFSRVFALLCDPMNRNMPENLEDSVVATGFKRSVFIPIPKKDNAKECSNYHTFALIPHASRVMLKTPQVRLQQFVNQELPDVQADL